ncbi:hypothetical protein SDC9_26437 [bioreactor metagenome]|uniref:Uncharacterized protein n=1 Tax=bioreactor metagenome TaxID=1076179 RepID=A0A644UN94_9ZZZZ
MAGSHSHEAPDRDGSREHDTKVEQHQHHVAHQMLQLQPGDGERRQKPERLHHVGPLIADLHRQRRRRDRGGQLLRRIHHHRALNDPLPAARRHEQIDQTGGEEGPDRQGLGAGNRDEPVREGHDQARARKDREDTGIERVLDDDPADHLHPVVQRREEPARGDEQRDAEEQEQQVHEVQRDGAALVEIEPGIEQAEQAHAHPDDPRMVQPLGEGEFPDLGLGDRQHRGGMRLDDLGGVLRVQHGVEQRQRDQQEQVHRNEIGREDRLAQRHEADRALEEVTGGVDEQRHRAREPHTVDGKARIARRDHQRIVQPRHLAPEFLRDQRAQHEAEAPVEPAADTTEQGGDDDRSARRVDAHDHKVHQLVHRRGARKDVARQQDHRHLHGEAEQVPEPLAPVAGGVDDPGALGEHGDQHGQGGQQDRHDQRVGHVAVHDSREKVGNRVQRSLPSGPPARIRLNLY